MLNEIDSHILSLLQDDARLSNAAIAEQVGLTTSTVYERIKKLEKKGVIERYVAVVNKTAVNKPISAFIRLVVNANPGEDYVECKKSFVTQCVKHPDVLECHSVAGEDCYVLKVCVAHTGDLEQLLEQLRSFGGVVKSTTSIVMSTFKETTKIATNN
ncbi:MAG: Lrp/AsnC family transcriptional regulator [Chloroflexi bacterium]|nr:Lrp/AsnC family transcriptional regulator [Chloroflexota bacterium]